MEIAMLGFRLVGGLVFAAHSAQELFGVSGGRGIRGTAGFVEQIGLRPDELRAWYPAAAA
jgi:putative oxidoreductase